MLQISFSFDLVSQHFPPDSCLEMIQWALLGLCIASIWVHNKYVAAYMLMSGVAMSRLGLWMFDLSVMQLMQVRLTMLNSKRELDDIVQKLI